MENKNSNNFSHYFVQFLTDTIIAMIIWPLINLFFCVVIDKQEFVYSVREYIFSPIMFGFFSVLFTNLLNKKNKNKKSN